MVSTVSGGGENPPAFIELSRHDMNVWCKGCTMSSEGSIPSVLPNYKESVT